MVKELFGILGILIVLFEIYRYLRKYWICRLLEKKKKEKRTRKPAVLRPKSERGKLPRLPFLSRGKGETNSSDARNACILAVAEGTGRAKKEDAHRRVLLPEQRLRVLRDHGRGDPCVGGVWDVWSTTWLKGITLFGIVTGLVESFTFVTGIEPVAISAAVGKGASGRTLAVFKPVAGRGQLSHLKQCPGLIGYIAPDPCLALQHRPAGMGRHRDGRGSNVWVDDSQMIEAR